MHRNEYYIWLSEALGAGSTKVKQLFEHFGSIENIYNASKQDYIDSGFDGTPARLKALCNKDLSAAQSILNFCRENHVFILPYEDSLYPQSFRTIKDPPVMLYCKGRMTDFNDNVCIAMVGSRTCTTSGIVTAYGVAHKCAQCGIIVVSGLAEGIDTACMSGALDAGGFTVGFIANGIDVVFPACNKALYERTVQSGIIMTEYAPQIRPKRMHFIQRNRLIAALSQGTVMYEGSMKSGAMSTVNFALEYGKTIYSLPGSITASTSEAPNHLIKNGARILTESKDIIRDYIYLYPHRISIPDARKFSQRILVPSELFEQGKIVTATRVVEISESEKTAEPKPASASSRQKKQSCHDEIPEPSPEPINMSENSTNTSQVKNAKKTAAGRTGKSAKKKEVSVTLQNTCAPESASVPTLSESVAAIVGKDGETIFNLIAKKKACTCDELVAETGIDIGTVLTKITLLETTSVIEQKPGGILQVL